MRFFDYVHDRGGRATLKAIAEPPSGFRSPLDAMERTLEHGRRVTVLINRMCQLAIEESDYAAQVMLHDLSNEQVEEEKQRKSLSTTPEAINGDGSGLLILDARLGERTAAEGLEVGA